MKEALFSTIDARREDLTGLADFIFDHPEAGGQETACSAAVAEYLTKNGFAVEQGLGDLPTALQATYQSLEGGPAIGLLCEYDATGCHSCGRHLQAPAMVGAAVALKERLGGKLPFKLVVYGTPDGEHTGKIRMLEAGCFRGMDVALHMRGGSVTAALGNTPAAVTYTLTYHGLPAHSAVAPDQGRSAFDAMQMAFHGLEFLKGHLEQGEKIRYGLVDYGGQPVNVIPRFAQGQVTFQAADEGKLQQLCGRLEAIVEASNLMAQTSCEVQKGDVIASGKPVDALLALFCDNAKLAGAENATAADKETVCDFANLQTSVPGLGFQVAFAPAGTGPYSKAWLDCGKSQQAQQALCDGAKITAAMVWDLIHTPDLLKNI